MHHYYGSGSGRIWFYDLHCTGSEMSLAECGRNRWGVHCHHGEDVSIVCRNG